VTWAGKVGGLSGKVAQRRGKCFVSALHEDLFSGGEEILREQKKKSERGGREKEV